MQVRVPPGALQFSAYNLGYVMPKVIDRNPKAVGERSEAQVLAKFLRAGKVVLTPFGDSQRYDMALDEGGGRFVRVQCKTGRLHKGVIEFPACSTNWNKGTTRDYRDDIEVFAVYVPDTDKMYIVPVDVVGKKSGSLRINPAKNGQQKNVRMASEFEFRGLEATRCD